jgi:predicted metal-dependent hydrolase
VPRRRGLGRQLREANERVLAELERDARVIASRFGLRYASLEAERAGVRRRYGVCYSDGRIKIRLRHAVTGEPLRYSSLVNTLCHELAHLRHFNHGERFRIFYRQVLEFARRAGIYRPHQRELRSLTDSAWSDPGRGIPPRHAAAEKSSPAPAPASGPTQLGLFH